MRIDWTKVVGSFVFIICLLSCIFQRVPTWMALSVCSLTRSNVLYVLSLLFFPLEFHHLFLPLIFQFIFLQYFSDVTVTVQWVFLVVMLFGVVCLNLLLLLSPDDCSHYSPVFFAVCQQKSSDVTFELSQNFDRGKYLDISNNQIL